jgi:hypothetical protein
MHLVCSPSQPSLGPKPAAEKLNSENEPCAAYPSHCRWPDIFSAGSRHGGAVKKKINGGCPFACKNSGTAQAKLLATRMMLVERKKALREQLRKSMSLHEEKIRSQSADYETQKFCMRKI